MNDEEVVDALNEATEEIRKIFMKNGLTDVEVWTEDCPEGNGVHLTMFRHGESLSVHILDLQEDVETDVVKTRAFNAADLYQRQLLGDAIFLVAYAA